MKTNRIILILGVLTLGIGGCATPYDYTEFRKMQPRSIVVIPPMNESVEVEATYGYLSTVTRPIAEMGYYIYPVAVVDAFLKENGLPSAGEMHTVPPEKFHEILDADAVLYITIKQYGTKYVIISSTTTVVAEGKLYDTRSGKLIWEGKAQAADNSGGSGNIIVDLVAAAATQAVNTSIDHAHQVSRTANSTLFMRKNYGLLYGHYHPEYQAPTEP
jgi:hypothetical protein